MGVEVVFSGISFTGLAAFTGPSLIDANFNASITLVDCLIHNNVGQIIHGGLDTMLIFSNTSISGNSSPSYELIAAYSAEIEVSLNNNGYDTVLIMWNR